MARLNPHGLTDKQERFCQEYLVDLNAMQAAIRAGYSEATAGAIGHENLNKPEIQERVAELMKERSDRTKITQDRVLAEIAAVAFYRPSRVLVTSPSGDVFMDYSKAEAEDLDMITEVKRTPGKFGDSVAIKRVDKLKALEMAGRHLGLFTDRHAHEGELGVTTKVVLLPHGQREQQSD